MPFANVFSVGDVLIAAGVVLVIVRRDALAPAVAAPGRRRPDRPYRPDATGGASAEPPPNAQDPDWYLWAIA